MKKVFSFLFVFSITTVHSFYVTGIGVAEQQTEEAASTSYIPNFATEIRAIEGALEKAPVVSLATLKDTLNQSSSLEELFEQTRNAERQQSNRALSEKLLEDLKNLHGANAKTIDTFERGLEKVNLSTVKALQDYADSMQRTRGRGAVLTNSTSISRSADFSLSKGSPLAGYMMKESEESHKIRKLLKAPPHQLVQLALEGHVNLKDFCAKNASLLETQMLMKHFLSEGGNSGITTENGKFRFIIMPKKSAKKLGPLF